MFRLAVLLCCACGRINFDGVSAEDSAEDRPNRIFVTAQDVAATFGGVVGGDAICQSAADAAELDGAFVALVWSSAGDPAARVAGSRGWVDLQGTPIADQAEPLWQASIHPLRVDEYGQPFGGFEAVWWGGPPSTNCDDWTSTTPIALPVVELDASMWTDAFTSCARSGMTHLICAEVGHVAAVAPIVETGRIIFVGEQPWLPSGGIAAADAVCQQEASAAGLSGEFLAFLPTTTTSAEARFSTTGLPWRRADGPRIVDTAAELVGPTPRAEWNTFIGRTARGTPTRERVWAGKATENCNDWAGGGTGWIARTHTRLRAQLLNVATSCTASQPLLCLER